MLSLLLFHPDNSLTPLSRSLASFFHRIVIISLIVFFFSPPDFSSRYPGILIALEPRSASQIYDANWYRVFSSYIGACRIGCTRCIGSIATIPMIRRRETTRRVSSISSLAVYSVDLSFIFFFFLFATLYCTRDTFPITSSMDKHFVGNDVDYL